MNVGKVDAPNICRLMLQWEMHKCNVIVSWTTRKRGSIGTPTAPHLKSPSTLVMHFYM